ncbi:hypothetical protein ACQ4WX_44920 [Streptomyces lasalocidi]
MRGSVVGTAVTLAAGTLLTAAMTTASASVPTTAPVRARPGQPVLVDCFFHRNVRPNDFILACGDDGNSQLTGLHWTQWSPDGAKAIGVNMVNDCKPYCAARHLPRVPGRHPAQRRAVLEEAPVLPALREPQPDLSRRPAGHVQAGDELPALGLTPGDRLFGTDARVPATEPGGRTGRHPGAPLAAAGAEPRGRSRGPALVPGDRRSRMVV